MKKKIIKFIIIPILLILFLLTFLFFGCRSDTPGDGAEKATEKIDDFTLLDLEGNEVSLSDFKGKIIILNFWATWCPPCRIEIPDFIEVYSQYRNKDVQFIGISMDTDMEALKKFVEDYNINYPILIDRTLDNVSGKFKIDAIPTTFILDDTGEVLFKQVGLMTKEQLIEAIEKWL